MQKIKIRPAIDSTKAKSTSSALTFSSYFYLTSAGPDAPFVFKDESAISAWNAVSDPITTSS